MTTAKFDLVVIGGGPGGYVAAIRAAQLDRKVALVEGEHLGGICLNWGCIPTKALLRTAEISRSIAHAGDFGIKVGKVDIDMAGVVSRSRKAASQLNKGVSYLLKKNKVEVFDGFGKLAGKQDGGHGVTVEKGGKAIATLVAKDVILAAGARARSLPDLKPDGKTVWTYKEAMVPEKLPASLLIIGSGAIGIEFASFYRALGAKVTVIEALDRILPVEDADVSKFAKTAFEKDGIEFVTGAMVETAKVTARKATVTLKSGKKSWDLSAEKLILAVGITGNTETLGLEGTSVKVEKGHVVVDEWLRTGEAGIYAIGDLVGPPWLAHKASHEGVICVEKISGIEGVAPLKTENIPGCTYCIPQIASVGLTEEKARENGREVRVGNFPFQANGKAIALGDPEGFVKTVFDAKTGELLGAHMVGPEVTELIQGYSIAKALETTEAELMHAVFPHPTLSEAMHESVLAAYGRAIHF